MAGRPLTVGVLGAGQIVVDLHMPTLRAMDDDVRVAWVADANRRRSEEVGRAFRVASLALPADLAELPRTDVVLVAIPYGARAPYYEALRWRRTALFVEKPFARTVDEHRSYLSWFRDTAVACGFQRRSGGGVQLLRRLIASGVFGPLRRMRIEHGIRGVLTGSGYSSDIRLAGGGILLEVGIHLVDTGLFVLGARGARVRGGRMLRAHGFDLHTDASMSVTTARGEQIPVAVKVSGLEDTMEGIVFGFDHARVALSFPDLRLTVRPATSDERFEIAGIERFGPSDPYQMCREIWRGFLDAVRTGIPNWTSAEDSILTTQVIEDLYKLDEGR